MCKQPLLVLGSSGRDLLETDGGPLVTTALAVAETGYMLSRGLGPAAESALVAMLCDGTLEVEPVSQADWSRVYELLNTFHCDAFEVVP